MGCRGPGRASSTSSTACSSTGRRATRVRHRPLQQPGPVLQPRRRLPRRVGRPAAPAERSQGPRRMGLVAELAHRVTVLDRAGTVLAGGAMAWPSRRRDRGVHSPCRMRRHGTRWSGARSCASRGPGLFSAPHGIAVDSPGSLYVAEASESFSGLDRGDRSIQKFVRARVPWPLRGLGPVGVRCFRHFP